jgi:hypothetical protein
MLHYTESRVYLPCSSTAQAYLLHAEAPRTKPQRPLLPTKIIIKVNQVKSECRLILYLYQPAHQLLETLLYDLGLQGPRGLIDADLYLYPQVLRSR